MYTVSILARSSVFVKGGTASPFANDDINYLPDAEEFSMILNHSHDFWWSNCTQKVCRNSLALMFAHISFENKEFSVSYMQTLFFNYNKSTFETMKTFERPILKLFQIQDSY